MNQLKAMRVFVRCVERGSFSAVALETGSTQPSISKLIASLEAQLGGALFERATTGVRLTPQGRDYYPRCKEIVEALDLAQEQFGRARDSVAGTVRLSASQAFGRLQVIPHLPALMRLHPQLGIDLQLNDRVVDLVADGIDLAFRMGQLRDSDLLARRIGTSRRATVASPGYLQRRGTPTVPEDLTTHDCLCFDGSGPTQTWRYQPAPGTAAALRPARVAVSGRLRTNGPESAREAALAGLGVAQLSRWMIGADLVAGRLVALLESYVLNELPIYAVFLRSARQAARVRAVVDFYDGVFRHDPLIRHHTADAATEPPAP